MRRYSVEDERRVRMQSRVGGWARAGLLDVEQGQRLQAVLAVGLLRTSRMLRAGLALFTALAVGAAVGVAVALFDLDGAGAIAMATGVASAVCFAVADRLVTRFRLYRYGVEEVMAVSAVVLLGISAATAVTAAAGPERGTAALVTALCVAAAASFGLYRRFGFVYAAAASVGCAAFVPLQLPIGEPARRLLAAGVFGVAFRLARRVRVRNGDEFPGDDAGVLQAVSLIGAYITLNVFLSPFSFTVRAAAVGAEWFRWATYLLVWATPAAGIWRGVRDRDQMLIDAGLATALATVVTSKSYLGLPRQPWDPILLGTLLVGVALGTRRWLARGPGGERAGFTSIRLSTGDPELVRIAGIASAGVDPAHELRSQPPQTTGFEGGRSGGAGGGAGF